MIMKEAFRITRSINHPRDKVDVLYGSLELKETPDGAKLTISHEVRMNKHFATREASFDFNETFYKTFIRWMECPSGELRLHGKEGSLIRFLFNNHIPENIGVYIDDYPFFDGFGIRLIHSDFVLDKPAIE